MTEAKPSATGAGLWRPYQIYVLALLLAMATSNYVDRSILAVLQEPIKAELRLSDSQLGLLSGPAFAIFYSLAGLPVARLAERVNRARLIATAVALWSCMTAACGIVHGFVHLALARMGVGLGEGGSIPISHSLISDYFTARQRGIVMSVLATATPLATIATPFLGGWLAERYGWRSAFLAIGLPGLVLAALAFFTLREPRNGPDAAPRRASTFGRDVGWLLTNRAFVFVVLGGAGIGIGFYGINSFAASFLIRNFDMSVAEAGRVIGLTGITGLVGNFLGGWLADRFADSRGRSYVLVPAAGSAATLVLYLFAFQAREAALVVPLLLAAFLTYNMKNGPLFAAVQNIAPQHMRATAAAVYMMGPTVMGAILGPLVTGTISDLSAAAAFPAALGDYSALCQGGRAAAGAAAPTIVAEACAQASGDGLRTSLTALAFIFALPAVALFISSLTIRMSASAEADAAPPRA